MIPGHENGSGSLWVLNAAFAALAARGHSRKLEIRKI
jgi:hypothetical protein